MPNHREVNTRGRRCVPVELIWEKMISRRVVVGECWEWSGGHTCGYGVMSFMGKSWRVHRLCWFLKHGPIEAGRYICHKCDNRSCWNPSHLFIGTQSDNIKDAVSKMRMARGEDHGRAVLNNKAIIEIRVSYERGEPGYLIARRLGVSFSSIYNILSKKSWSHV